MPISIVGIEGCGWRYVLCCYLFIRPSSLFLLPHFDDRCWRVSSLSTLAQRYHVLHLLYTPTLSIFLTSNLYVSFLPLRVSSTF
ncbi:hypothetical protein GALMADRAFT_765561 [Galerina marginata CBS 339.88]|uniref:Uncharacterized protein n=1 Tax=Galerina marginata (strain CBS 339.88) TaxID=685588 RepID=A0A067SZH4_GALM3|nr:hypothetical protein GALMADRAFT_765561 [Galerina marginata CBS 339.88]